LPKWKREIGEMEAFDTSNYTFVIYRRAMLLGRLEA
jgi:hypothetical protein